MTVFIESKGALIGDTLMQTPALRALRRAEPDVEIVYVAEPDGLARLALRHNPNVDRFAKRADPAPRGRHIEISAWEAMQYGIRERRSMLDGFAAQLGISIPSDGYALDMPLTQDELRAGEALIETFGTNYKVVVCARHSTTDHSNLQPGALPNKCFSNDVWCEVADWLIGLGYVPLAVGSAADALDPRFERWPGPRLYAHPLRTVAALIASARATFCVDTGIRFMAAAVGCDLVCVSGHTPTWLVSCSPSQEGQTIVERQVPVPQVTTELCRELLWRVL